MMSGLVGQYFSAHMTLSVGRIDILPIRKITKIKPNKNSVWLDHMSTTNIFLIFFLFHKKNDPHETNVTDRKQTFVRTV